MNGLVLATCTAMLAAVGGPFIGLAGRNHPPQPFDEKTTLEGKVPPTPKSVSGPWHYDYQQDEAPLEGGKSHLVSGIQLTLRGDGTYQLHYWARWGSPGPLDGVNVTENGRFSLSGEILLLEPSGTTYTGLEKNNAKPAQVIANEKHALIVRLDGGHLNVAGRCASYQVDPVCRTTPTIWFPMKAPIGTRWLGREPK
jgi:hypothetical protein